MYRTPIIHWLLSLRHHHKPNETSQAIDASLEASALQFQSIDPETGTQWKKMQVELARRRYSPNTPGKILARYLPRPSISFAVAAIMLTAAGIFLFLTAQETIYATAKGQHLTMTLPDGSEVRLNNTSQLTVYRSLFGRTRLVSLTGEAFFHVQKDGTPFSVTTDVGTVQVLGTQFNVRARDGRMEVAVMSGRVQINAVRKGIDSSVILGQKQFSTCVKDNFPDLPGEFPFSGYPGWMDGKITFYRTNVISACREIESQFDVIIRVEGSQIPAQTITGTLGSGTAESAVAALARLTGKHFHHEDNTYIIY